VKQLATYLNVIVLVFLSLIFIGLYFPPIKGIIFKGGIKGTGYFSHLRLPNHNFDYGVALIVVFVGFLFALKTEFWPI